MSSRYCPSCGVVAMGFLRKAMTPPLRNLDCPNCGVHIGPSIKPQVSMSLAGLCAIKALDTVDVWLAFAGIGVV